MLNLREKLGQLFMVTPSGPALSADERLMIEEYGIGGFVLFKRNCRAPQPLVDLCRTLWNSGASAPPFIAIDQEGGEAHRLPAPFTRFPTPDLIGRSGRPKLAFRAGRATADELVLAGISVNFAPVLDINSNPNNPVIGTRAFGRDPATVITFSDQWIAGLRSGGIIPCGKHFPGHGDTDKDSHRDLPVVARPLADLQRIELAPFAHACRGRIESLMTAHVVFTALDADFPATLSEKIITGLLRQQLGYEGVVFTDALEMKAISEHYGVEQSAALCLRAGVDVLLYCDGLEKPLRAFEFLYSEAEADAALRGQIERSYERIIGLKQKYLKSFTGVDRREVKRRLRAFDHARIVDEIYGSL